MRIIHRPTDKISKAPFRTPDVDHIIQIPDGIYVAAFCESCSTWVKGKPKIAAWFLLLDEAPGTERRICRFYKVRGLTIAGVALKDGDRNRRPEFEIGWKSDIARDLGMLFPDEVRPDRLPSVFPSLLEPVQIATRTVTTDMSGKERPIAFHHSVVDHIVGWA